MRLEDLKPNFALMNCEEQRIFFVKYAEKRAVDLIKVVITKKARKGSGKKVAVTAETLEILSKLKLI